MAGIATAYSTEALTPSGGLDHEKWEFAVPLGNEVCSTSPNPAMLFICRSRSGEGDHSRSPPVMEIHSERDTQNFEKKKKKTMVLVGTRPLTSILRSLSAGDSTFHETSTFSRFKPRPGEIDQTT